MPNTVRNIRYRIVRLAKKIEIKENAVSQLKLMMLERRTSTVRWADTFK